MIAILDTGIKWDNAAACAPRSTSTRGELPRCRSTPTAGRRCGDATTANGDGAFNVARLRRRPARQPDAGPHGTPADRRRGPDRTRSPTAPTPTATASSTTSPAGTSSTTTTTPTTPRATSPPRNHGSGRAENAAERGNDGDGGIGVCPHCQIMPIRTWDTFVSDGNTFAMGILYATDNGVAVIEGANGSTYHSAFAEAASQYAYDHGVVQTFSGDDLNTGNHNYPANYGHAMLIQGTVPDTVGPRPGRRQRRSPGLRALRTICRAGRLPGHQRCRSGPTSAAPTRPSTAARARSRWRARPAPRTPARRRARRRWWSAPARDAPPPVDAAPRRDARDPRADRRAGDRPATPPAPAPPTPAPTRAPSDRPVDDRTSAGAGSTSAPRSPSRRAARSRPRRRSTRPTGTRR